MQDTSRIMNSVYKITAVGSSDEPLPVTARARRAGDRSLADYLRHCAASATGGAVEERDGVLLFSGAHHYPGGFTNGMIRRSGELSAGVALDRAESFFHRRQRAFVVWTRAHADADLVAEASRRGYRIRPPEDGLHGVYCDVPPPAAARSLPAGAQIREVDDDAGYLDYLDVIAEAWQLGDAPRQLAESVLFSVDSLRTPDMRVFVAYRDGRALAASAMFFAGGIGGMQWTGIRAEARGVGLGQAAFLPAWRAAFEMGASLIVGQASAIGTGVWLRHGWQEVTRYGRYISPPVVHR